MPAQLLARICGVACLAGTLMGVAWAVEPQPTPAEIRAKKIEFLQDCCYNAGGAIEQNIASLSTEKLLQYPAQRRAVEAQVPLLNRMFAGRYLAHVVVLDDWKLRILYFVKDLNAQDVARVKANPQLPKVQLANSAYAAGDVSALAQQYAKEIQQRSFHPQGTAAFLGTWGVRYPSLQSVEAFPNAVMVRHDARRTHEVWPTLKRVFGAQLIVPVRENDTLILGNPQRQAYVYRPTQDQLLQLRSDPDVRDVNIIPYGVSQAEIERVRALLNALIFPPGGIGVADMLFTSLGFDYERRAFKIGVMPGKMDEARQRFTDFKDVPANCCVLEEEPPQQALAGIKNSS